VNRKSKLKVAEAFLTKHKWAEPLRKDVLDAVEAGRPVLESLCFQTLAEHLLAPIHTSSWIDARAKGPVDCPERGVLRRLLDAGASAQDLAVFARMMQQEYLSNLGCLLIGEGPFPKPELPYDEFRVFSVDESGKPLAKIEIECETLQFSDVENETRRSRLSVELSSELLT
jgi:hypothetical protein